MAFAWDLFAEEIGRVGERAGARVAQRGIDKRAEERAYRMHEERLQIEEPFKELSNERITARQKELADYNIELQKGMEEWRGELSRKLNILAGKEGYQEAIKRARKDGGLSQVAIMQMEDVIMRLHMGEVPDEKDMAVFEALEPFDRLPFMDLFKQNQIKQTEFRQIQERIDNEATRLQRALDAKPSLVDIKRGLDIEDEAQEDEKEFSNYFSDLMNELMGGKKGVKGVLDTQGRFKIVVPGRLKKRQKDIKAPLINMETGEINQWVLDELYKKHPTYRLKFRRLRELQANVMRSRAIIDEFMPTAPTVETPIDPELQRQLDRLGITREQAEELLKKSKK